MILQLKPPIPVYVPHLQSSGFCLGWIDYSQEHDMLWIIGLKSGEIWTLPQNKVRLQENVSLGRSASVNYKFSDIFPGEPQQENAKAEGILK